MLPCEHVHVVSRLKTESQNKGTVIILRNGPERNGTVRHIIYGTEQARMHTRLPITLVLTCSKAAECSTRFSGK